MFRRAWWWLPERLTVWAGRLGCRLLDRHHYQACRGRADHGARLVDGYPAPVRR